MDDEEPSSGMGTLAAYALGRMSMQREQSLRNLARTFGQRFQPQAPTVDVNALIADNQDLLAENQELRRQLKAARSALTEYEFNYAELKKWAREAEAKLREAGLLLD
ncbi:hypothetical protein QMO56_21405 [Roseomonas sp. E05]|uniref:hypothetical protein n=1 Tax=Roseomonas sp. E05 TaxID=3046310 RepID=UPI0024BBA3E2|nr:hypothetical protein [Roseomonas sp. E05]MDJ0390676.1 hypothetical protein [Roseomonas sp. E05]